MVVPGQRQQERVQGLSPRIIGTQQRRVTGRRQTGSDALLQGLFGKGGVTLIQQCLQHGMLRPGGFQHDPTPLLTAARREGSKTANGLSMLVHQAAVAFEHWTGTAAPLDVMVAAIA